MQKVLIKYLEMKIDLSEKKVFGFEVSIFPLNIKIFSLPSINLFFTQFQIVVSFDNN